MKGSVFRLFILIPYFLGFSTQLFAADPTCTLSQVRSFERRLRAAERSVQISVARESKLSRWCETHLSIIEARKRKAENLRDDYLPYCSIAAPTSSDERNCRRYEIYGLRVERYESSKQRAALSCENRRAKQKDYTRRARERVAEFQEQLALCGESSGGVASGGDEADQFRVDGSIPYLREWEAQMEQFGRVHCDRNKLEELSTWEGSVWYYDGVLVFYQIADYTGDASWATCARYVRDVYRRYVLASAGTVPGWRVFPWGLYEDFRRSGAQESKSAVGMLATSSAFADEGGGRDHTLSRETAYVIHAYLAAESLGQGRHPALGQAVNNALSHLDQWSGTKSAEYVQPFMVGLTMEALIAYDQKHGDSRILPAIARTAEWLWSYTWNSQRTAFRYIKCKSTYESQNSECRADYAAAAPDLNLLIAPAYGWLYAKLGDLRFRDWGDQIFAGGVKDAWLSGGKQFSQNYRWSFDYIRWRSER